MAVAECAERTTGGRRGALCALALAAGLALTLTACTGSPTAPDDAQAAAVAQDPTTSTDARVLEDEADTSGPAAQEDVTEHSAVRSVVDGFPVDLLPLPEDAMILVTSAVPVGDADVQEVSLNLRTQSSATALMDLYRGTLEAAGFTELPPETPHDDLAAETTYVRSGGDELVSIGVLDDDGARTVTIGARLRTDG